MPSPSATFPVKRYSPWLALTGLSGGGRVAVYFAEQAASQLPFWAQIPWISITIFAIGALIGTIYADVVNSESQLRNWWKKKRSFAVFNQVYHKQVLHDRGPNHGGIMRHAGIILPVEFRRKTSLDGIRITAYVYGFRDHMPISMEARATHTWKTEVGQQYLKGDIIDVPLAHIPYQRGHPGYYGELDSSGYYLSDGSAHLIIVELLTSTLVQSRQFLVLLPTREVSSDGERTTTGGRFIVFEQGNALFPEPPRDKSGLFDVRKI